MESLGQEQLHCTVFEGSDASKSENFQGFLKDIGRFISEQGIKTVPLILSYHWSECKDVHEEAWRADFFRGLKRHLEIIGLSVSLDEVESFVGHDLNAHMKRIEQLKRVYPLKKISLGYLLLLKYLINKAGVSDQKFDDYWQERLLAYQIVDASVGFGSICAFFPGIKKSIEIAIRGEDDSFEKGPSSKK